MITMSVVFILLALVVVLGVAIVILVGGLPLIFLFCDILVAVIIIAFLVKILIGH